MPVTPALLHGVRWQSETGEFQEACASYPHGQMARCSVSNKFIGEDQQLTSDLHTWHVLTDTNTGTHTENRVHQKQGLNDTKQSLILNLAGNIPGVNIFVSQSN